MGGVCGGVSRERGGFGSASNLRGPVEHRLRPPPPRSPPLHITSQVAAGKHACAAASPAAVGLRRGNPRSGSQAGKGEAAVQRRNDSGKLRSANLL